MLWTRAAATQAWQSDLEAGLEPVLFANPRLSALHARLTRDMLWKEAKFYSVVGPEVGIYGSE